MKKINHSMKNSIAVVGCSVPMVAVNTAMPPVHISIVAYLVNVFKGYGVFTSNPMRMLEIMNKYINWGNSM